MHTTKEKHDPFASLDSRKLSLSTSDRAGTVETLRDADEALAFLENHPRAVEIAEEGAAILEDPVQLRRLVRKIDLTIAPLLAAVYFLQFLDKTTLSYTAVMGIREQTHLVGQDYSNLSMLFYIGNIRLLHSPVKRELCTKFDAGFLAAEFPTQYLAQHISRLGVYLGVNIVIWGFVLGCHAACTTFAGLAVCRVLLGIFESWYAAIPNPPKLTHKIIALHQYWYSLSRCGTRNLSRAAEYPGSMCATALP